MRKHRIAAALALVLVLCLAACGSKAAVAEESSDSGVSFQMKNLSGGFTRELELAEGDNLAFAITVTGGSLDIGLQKGSEKPVYRGNDARTGSFTVVIPEAGDYTLSIAGKNLSGTVSIQK